MVRVMDAEARSKVALLMASVHEKEPVLFAGSFGSILDDYTIQAFPRRWHDTVSHLGFGCFEGKTHRGKFSFDGGGAMMRIQNGEGKHVFSYTRLRAEPHVIEEMEYDFNAVCLALKEMLQTEIFLAKISDRRTVENRIYRWFKNKQSN